MNETKARPAYLSEGSRVTARTTTMGKTSEHVGVIDGRKDTLKGPFYLVKTEAGRTLKVRPACISPV